MTNQEIIKTIKYLNFCGLCTTGDCKNCARKIAKDKVLELLERDTAKQPIEHTKQVGFPFYECPICGEKMYILKSIVQNADKDLIGTIPNER